MNHWFNYEATAKILVFSLVLGAGLPALFALGVQLHAAGAGTVGQAGGHAPSRRQVLVALGWAIFGLVLAVVVIGVLYIARDFIAHHIGWHILGAQRA